MNLPNKLTLLRIVFVPITILIWLFPYEQFGIRFITFNIATTSVSLLNIVVLILFILASFTDMLDGMIARKRNLITTFGKFADPIADKLLVNSFLIIMAYKHMLPIVPVVIMIARDIIVDGCRMIAATNRLVVAAGLMGKLKTVLQIVTIGFTLLNNLPFELLAIPFTTLLVWFTAFVSIAGGYSYFKQVEPFIFETM